MARFRSTPAVRVAEIGGGSLVRRGGKLFLNPYSRHTAFLGRECRASYLRIPLEMKFDLVLSTFALQTICKRTQPKPGAQSHARSAARDDRLAGV